MKWTVATGFSLLLAMLLLLGGSLATDTPPETVSAAGVTIEEAVERLLSKEMAHQAQLAENGWEKFIFSQGFAGITMTLDAFDVERGKPLKVQFLLASGQPDIRSLEAYEVGGDPQMWLEALQEVMRTHDTTCQANLLIVQYAGGFIATFAPGAEASLQKSVKALARKASGAYKHKFIRQALTDYLMPTPVAIPGKKAPESLSEGHQPAFSAYVARNGLHLKEERFLEAFLYSIRDYKLDSTAGPEAFVLSYTMPDLTQLVNTATETVLHDLAFDANAKSYTRDELAVKLSQEANKTVAAYRHSNDRGSPHSHAFSILSLPESTNYEDLQNSPAYLAKEVFEAALRSIEMQVAAFPDYLAIPYPETGLMTGESKGRYKFVFDASKEIIAHYEKIYDENGALVCSFFVRPGERATIYLPAGIYRNEASEGMLWYGPEHRFGQEGNYTETVIEAKRLPDNRYTLLRYNVIELNGAWEFMESTPLDYYDLVGK